MQVPPKDPEWINNLRRSLVSLIRVPLVTSSPVSLEINRKLNILKKNKISLPYAFTSIEDSIHGTCEHM